MIITLDSSLTSLLHHHPDNEEVNCSRLNMLSKGAITQISLVDKQLTKKLSKEELRIETIGLFSQVVEMVRGCLSCPPQNRSKADSEEGASFQ